MKFPAEHFEAANVIAMFVGEEDAVELRGSDSALFEPHDDLACAQPAIDQEPAMIGRDERAISRAAAAEHGQSEHRWISSGRSPISQIRNGAAKKIDDIFLCAVIPSRADGEGPHKRSPGRFREALYFVCWRGPSAQADRDYNCEVPRRLRGSG